MFAGSGNPGDGKALREFRADADGHKFAHDFAALRNTALPENEDVLHSDDFAFHSGDLGQVGDFTSAVAESRDLHDDVDSGGNLATDGRIGNVQRRHGHHGLETG